MSLKYVFYFKSRPTTPLKSRDDLSVHMDHLPPPPDVLPPPTLDPPLASQSMPNLLPLKPLPPPTSHSMPILPPPSISSPSTSTPSNETPTKNVALPSKVDSDWREAKTPGKKF
jgi:hypothetical protein